MFLLRPLRGGSAMFNSRCTMSFAAVMAAFCLALDGAADTFTVTSATEFQEVLNTAAANGEHDTINVAAGTYNLATTGVNTLTYTPVSSENFALTIVGEGASSTAITDGQPNLVINTSGIVDTGANVTIRDIAFLYGDSYSTTNGGGGLFVRTTSAEITIEDCDFGENGAVNNGGGDARSPWIPSGSQKAAPRRTERPSLMWLLDSLSSDHVVSACSCHSVQHPGEEVGSCIERAFVLEGRFPRTMRTPGGTRAAQCARAIAWWMRARPFSVSCGSMSVETALIWGPRMAV